MVHSVYVGYFAQLTGTGTSAADETQDAAGDDE